MKFTTARKTVTKRVCKSGSFDLQEYMDNERACCEKFQEQMLSEIEKGNEQFARSIELTKSFQDNFLLLMCSFAPCD